MIGLDSAFSSCEVVSLVCFFDYIYYLKGVSVRPYQPANLQQVSARAASLDLKTYSAP